MSEHSLNEVFTTPYLPKEEAKGWVTFNDHLVKIEWKLKESLFITRTYKALCESVAAEAALMKGQTEVIIRNKIHTVSPEHGIPKQQKIAHDPHITINFPALDRQAHIYIGPENEKDYRKMKIWRRQGRPAVVLC